MTVIARNKLLKYIDQIELRGATKARSLSVLKWNLNLPKTVYRYETLSNSLLSIRVSIAAQQTKQFTVGNQFLNINQKILHKQQYKIYEQINEKEE
jgi:hypothetical protein